MPSQKRFRRRIAGAGCAGLLAGLLALDATGHEGHDLGIKVQVPLMLSPQAQSGEELYDTKCSDCHGKNAGGTHSGPSLIPYDSGHHPDGEFEKAIRSGVDQHHWNFGDMPPIEGISDEEIADLITYIRELQAFNSDAHHHNKVK